MTSRIDCNGTFADIQAVIRTGYTRLRQGRYLLLTVGLCDRDRNAARAWLGAVPNGGLVHTAWPAYVRATRKPSQAISPGNRPGTARS